MIISEKDLKNKFGRATFEKGQYYYAMGRVNPLRFTSFSDTHLKIETEVQGSRKPPYAVQITLRYNQQGDVAIAGDCACPMGYPCKHVVAALLALQKDRPSNPLSDAASSTMDADRLKNIEISQENKMASSKNPSFEHWIKQVETLLTPAPSIIESNSPYRLLYRLRAKTYGAPGLTLDLILARSLKKGGYSGYKIFSAATESHYKALLAIDHAILHRLEILRRATHRLRGDVYQSIYDLADQLDPDIFADILKTGRCYWNADPTPLLLTVGESKRGQLVWELADNGEQRLSCQIQDETVTVLPLLPLWYLQLSTGLCGLLETGLAPALSKSFLFAPPLLPQDTPKLRQLMTQRLKQPEKVLPVPRPLVRLPVEPTTLKPKLWLWGCEPYNPYFDLDWITQDACIPLGRVSFLYDAIEVQLSDPAEIYSVDREKNQLRVFSRQFEQERAYIDTLLQPGIHFFAEQYPHLIDSEIRPHDFLIGQIGDEASQKDFLYGSVPKLKALKWEVIVDPSFPVEYRVSVDEWYSDLQETSDHNWFDLELGFVLNDQKINLLPLLVQLIEQNPSEFTAQSLQDAANKSYVVALPDGQSVEIPGQRIQGILAILSELHDRKSLNANGKLSVTRWRAPQLIGLEKAMQTTQVRWLGAERLQKLSEKLTQFTSITPVKIPKTFKGKLRDYQKQGVDWLGFLREYQLGGILSDDMGLGKTVQTLAHILVEKEAKRLNHPCLIVAPTSLMGNWKQEAEQFSPSLKVLTLQGQFRKTLFDDLKTADIVLTTYPLLVRDQEVLAPHQYEMIILDEAQYAKNANTQAYQILQQLSANHRLCLTGTPMENHLGELWSLFNFLSPGLLGSSKQFAQVFRTPIEKQNDRARQKSLHQRIHPYMLRRTKEAVVLELPPKTEIVHSIELEDKQRDLYESIRLSMTSKLSQVIQEKGLAKSQIWILDALLKLRQTCCDPRLLPLKQAKMVKQSAKLNFLLEMLPKLIEEGRKILLFSSFTSMLTLIEEALREQSIEYVKLTGATRDRETPIQAFQKSAVPIFLISLKAGGTGLNLTAADTVIHYDPWWNPAAELQATDRAHRIGQTKPVFVYKLVTVGTVEEKILSMQQKKKALLDNLFEAKKTTKVVITKEDLNFLFKPITAMDEVDMAEFA